MCPESPEAPWYVLYIALRFDTTHTQRNVHNTRMDQKTNTSRIPLKKKKNHFTSFDVKIRNFSGFKWFYFCYYSSFLLNTWFPYKWTKKFSEETKPKSSLSHTILMTQ